MIDTSKLTVWIKMGVVDYNNDKAYNKKVCENIIM